MTGMSNVYECTLPKSERVSVQLGDIVGIELSRPNNARFRLYFGDNSGPTNYIFNGRSPQLQAVNLNENSGTEPAQPQVSLTMQSSTSSDGNGAATAGAVICSIIAILIVSIVICLLIFVLRRRRNLNKNNYTPPAAAQRFGGIDVVAQNINAVDVETKANLSYVPVFRQILTGDNIAYERNQAGNGVYLTIIAPTEDYAQVHGNIETQQNEEESHDVSYDYID